MDRDRLALQDVMATTTTTTENTTNTPTPTMISGRMTSPDLTEFLFARIAEDKAVAKAATAGSWEVRPYWFKSNGRSWATVPDVIDEDIDAKDAQHIARWNPARVLAECEAKRQIVQALAARGPDAGLTSEADKGATWALYQACKLLALPYADHPDYRQEWRP